MKVLISGGGIAGSAAALFLARDGHAVSVIDKAESFQPLGYMLSLKSFGLRIMQELGLLAALKQHELSYSVFQFRYPDDHLIQEYLEPIVRAVTRGELFTYRSALHRVLYEAASRAVGIRFGLEIASLTERESGIEVTLSDGSEDAFDIVVVAEGLRSSTRHLLWGDKGLEPLDLDYHAATIEHSHGFAAGTMTTYSGPGTMLLCFPITPERLVIQSYLRARPGAGADRQAVWRLLLDAHAGYAPRLKGMIESLRPEDYVFHDGIAMVDLPALTRGRVALLGDAGYCPTFMSGMGASLALLGAKLLARSLAPRALAADHALAQYDAAIRPTVRHYQDNARRNAQALVPKSWLKWVALNWLLHVTPPETAVRRFGKQFEVESSLLEALEH